MSDFMKLSSDTIKVTDTDIAEQIVNEYLTTAELTLELQSFNDDHHITLNGSWIFAVEHQSNTDQDHTIGEPIHNLDFLADIARITAPDSLPFTITEVCEGTLDEHPGLTRYTVTADTITMRTDYGKELTWDVADHGIITATR